MFHIWQFNLVGTTNDVFKRFDSKDLAKRTVLDKILTDRAYEIAPHPKYDRLQMRLASMVYKCFDKIQDQMWM